jgi:4-amino-4-deoxy-L-arabinose transferase-like glycosyltransferase
VAIAALSLATLGLRFIQLESDFPYRINWSGDLYTDEGWYTTNAISHSLTGRWLVEGDFNPILTLPVFPLIQSAAFRLLGFGLVTARFTGVAFSVLLVLASYKLVAHLADRPTALLACLLLSTNFTVFAFSRVALLDLPMAALTVLSLLVAVSDRGSRAARSTLAALVFALAILTKTTALFALPSLLYLIGSAQPGRREAIRESGTVLALIGLLIGGYYVVIGALHPEAAQRFAAIEFAPRLGLTIPAVGQAVGRAIWGGRVLDPVAYPLTLLGLPVLLMAARTARRDRWVLAATFWVVVSLAGLAVRGYLPPRYYLPLAVPLSGLLAVMAVHAYRALHGRPVAYLPLLVPGAIAAINLFAVGRHLASPQFSFVAMAADVAKHIEAGDGKFLLVGNLANSVSLATGVPSINSELGTEDLQWKLQRYRPGYYLALGEEKPTVRTLSESFDLELLASYDVFGNYVDGKQVRLYRLHPASGSQGEDG